MGTRRTYHRAPTGLRSARAVAAEILKFLHRAALEESGIPLARVVVTVPASFQAAQRQDTVDAAQRAGLSLSDGELLDEPVAAFLHYLAQEADERAGWLPGAGQARNLVVFDFGGGTCDVAVFRLGRAPEGRLTIRPLAVSRYHRLGGGDIDRAIIHEVLLPQLIHQNDLDPFSLEFEDKRQRMQPALLAVAEALKQNLSIEISRLQKLGRWEKLQRAAVVQTIPALYEVHLKDRTLYLNSPKLSAVEFERILAPFFDKDLLLPRKDEYRVTCSIFAPLGDAVLRGGIDPCEVDLCLLVGGSSLLPQLPGAVQSYFPNARLLRFASREETQTAVAQGAALQALSLALVGKGILKAVCHDDSCLLTSAGPTVLVPRGAELPYPAGGGFERREGLKVPMAVPAHQQGQIRVSIVAGDEQRPLFHGLWKIPGPARKGARLELDFRFDENQVLHLRLGRQGGTEAEAFEASLENPLTHVVNPNATRARVEELEEDLRTRQTPREELPGKFEELADLHRQLRQYEKALAYYRRALPLLPAPPAYLLNRIAFCARDLGDRERAERFFAAADRIDPWSGTCLNWALSKEQWGATQDALKLVDRAIQMDDEPPYAVLRARLLQKLGDIETARTLAAEALERFLPPASLGEFELSWLLIGARLVGDQAPKSAAEAEVRSRKARRPTRVPAGGELPDLERTPGEAPS